MDHLGTLHALASRLSLIAGGQPFKAADVPVSPQRLCKVFALCSERLAIETDALLVLYTLFDKHVLGRLGSIHEALNQHLVDAGVLPNLKYQIRQGVQTATRKDAGTAAETSAPQAATQPAGSNEAAAPPAAGRASAADHLNRSALRSHSQLPTWAASWVSRRNVSLSWSD